MNKQNKIITVITGVVFLFTLSCNRIAQTTEINRIDKEQKLYELSVVWKELSYNFANMDNCPNVVLDSLYREYMTIVQNTENDWEYYKAMQRFLAHFNNGHVSCSEIPGYLNDYLGYLLLTTTYKDNKIIVENIGAHNADKINIGDEIVTINDMPAMDYFRKFSIPYISASNEEVKIRNAMFGRSYCITTALKDEKIKLGIKTPKGIKKVTLAYDYYLRPQPKEEEAQSERYYLDIHPQSMRNNLFLEDTVNDFAYIRLTRCDESFYTFSAKNYDKIRQYKNLIIDVHYNAGGSSDVTWSAISCLVNNDSIYHHTEKTRVNNALKKAWPTAKILNENLEMSEKWNPYYYNTAFEKDTVHSGKTFPNGVPDSLRYKGKVYVLISEDNGSAGEYFVIMLSQNKDITFLGKKTAGAIGQPLLVRLPSGIEVMINTVKAYDIQGRDVSSGFPPDYEYDFSEIYKINDRQEMLGKLIEVIKGLEK